MKLRNLFVRPREKKSQYRPTSVKCYGCERQKAGGSICRDHTSMRIDPVWQPQKRWCVRCRKNEIVGNVSDLCMKCMGDDLAAQRQAIMRQQMMQLHQALAQWPVTGPGFTSGYTKYQDRVEMAQTEAEVVVGPILAFRVWKLAHNLGDAVCYWLKSAGNGDKDWKAKEPMTGDVTVHGVYAWRDRNEISLYSRRHDTIQHVAGGVFLWGDVIEHEDGYRASHGYPAFLWSLQRRTHNIQHRPDRAEYVCLSCGESVTEVAAANYPGQLDPLFALMGANCVASRNPVMNSLAELYGIPVVEVESWNDLVVPDKETLLFEEDE